MNGRAQKGVETTSRSRRKGYTPRPLSRKTIHPNSHPLHNEHIIQHPARARGYWQFTTPSQSRAFMLFVSSAAITASSMPPMHSLVSFIFILPSVYFHVLELSRSDWGRSDSYSDPSRPNPYLFSVPGSRPGCPSKKIR